MAVQPEEAQLERIQPEEAKCGPGDGRAGWFFGEPSDGPPADAPLHALLLAASRIMGTFYAGTLTSVVNTLVREGYVERRSDAGDRRVVRLFVTDKGRQVCEDYFAFAGPQWRDAFGFVDPADEPVIRKFFTDLIEHFSELIRKERGK
jgi:hypothetical protein